ncbi:ankyrin-3-like isoform X2 [Haliotis rubra]|nr:ankyrin-3-like isoform X2 [Haliotis rubra]
MLKYFLLVIIITIEVKSEECPLGTYGETCDKNCSTNCAPSADKKVHCHKLTGKCSEGCNRGWHRDQCNLGCSRNCLNNVCQVQTGTCIKCKANYSGDYCETDKESGPKEWENQSAQEVASPPLAAILVPVVVMLIVSIGINIALIVYKIRSKGLKKRMKQHLDDEGQRLTSSEYNNSAAMVSPLQHQDTGLHDACKEGNLQRVRGILDQSIADIDKKGKDGMTPVMWAARRGHRDILDLLVKKDANLTLVDIVSNNILHWACRGGNVSMVKHIISMKTVDIKSKGRDGRTPLMYAARKGEYKIFQLLVSKGGLPSQEDHDGNNILQLACWGGSVKMVEYILKHKRVDINGRGQSGRTPLMAAAYQGHGKILDLLERRGADLNAADYAGNNALHSACLGGHVDIVRRVLELDKVDINSRGQCGRTPLMMAARMGDREIFELLVEGGADATPVDDDSNNILHLASKGGNLDIVNYVLSLENVDINARNKHDETPTMMATRGGEVCDLLVTRDGLIDLSPIMDGRFTTRRVLWISEICNTNMSDVSV